LVLLLNLRVDFLGGLSGPPEKFPRLSQPHRRSKIAPQTFTFIQRVSDNLSPTTPKKLPENSFPQVTSFSPTGDSFKHRWAPPKILKDAIGFIFLPPFFWGPLGPRPWDVGRTSPSRRLEKKPDADAGGPAFDPHKYACGWGMIRSKMGGCLWL